MPCYSTSNTWIVTPQARTSLGEGFQFNTGPNQFVVQLIQEIGCCQAQYQILVNNQSIQHSLTTNIYSPLCCSGGEYGWEQDGHHFLLIYDSVSLQKVERFRLFVDGYDVGTGMEFKAFWRRQGIRFALLGLAFLLLGAILTCLLYFYTSAYYGGLGLLCLGITYVVMGLIPILRKYDSPRYQHGTVTHDRM